MSDFKAKNENRKAGRTNSPGKALEARRLRRLTGGAFGNDEFYDDLIPGTTGTPRGGSGKKDKSKPEA